MTFKATDCASTEFHINVSCCSYITVLLYYIINKCNNVTFIFATDAFLEKN